MEFIYEHIVVPIERWALFNDCKHGHLIACFLQVAVYIVPCKF